MPRSNLERTQETQQALIQAARQLFIESGYADTATPDIVNRAGVTRGALYHHYEDKKALLLAVIEAEYRDLQATIESVQHEGSYDLAAFLQDIELYLRAMTEAGRARLLLLEGPAVLGADKMSIIDGAHMRQSLKEGLEALMLTGEMMILPLEATTQMLSSMLDGAVMGLQNGLAYQDINQAISSLLYGLKPNR